MSAPDACPGPGSAHRCAQQGVDQVGEAERGGCRIADGIRLYL